MDKMSLILGGVIGSVLTLGILALLSSDEEPRQNFSSADDAILGQETKPIDETDTIAA